MTRMPPPPLTDDELHALVDGQLSSSEFAELTVRLACDRVGQTKLMQWRRQRDMMRDLHGQVLQETVPPALLQATQRATTVRQSGMPWWRYGGMAAGVVLAFGAGWLSNAQWANTMSSLPSTPVMSRVQMEHEFVRQAGLAHSVYTPEVRHPVEVTATDQTHLVQWLSKRLSKPLKVPDLTAQGFTLVGGRLLPGEAGARAQFMFQNSATSRVTLYLGALDATGVKGLSNEETGFRYEPQAGVPSFYWVDQGFGYALAGQLPPDTLMKLAETIYHQL